MIPRAVDPAGYAGAVRAVLVLLAAAAAFALQVWRILDEADDQVAREEAASAAPPVVPPEDRARPEALVAAARLKRPIRCIAGS